MTTTKRKVKTKKFSQSDEERWLAIVNRDANADGQFYYSVSTTGVYCRPSCPSRLAKREHVRFHETIEDAELAGFRPCKRCKPRELSPNRRNVAMVTNICRMIETSEVPPSLDTLAKASGLSRYHFHRVFKSITGLTPKAYATAHRAKRVRSELASGNTVTEVIYNTGFNSNGRFYGSTAHILGMTPTRFRNAGADTLIRFAVGESSLGSILVAATQKGVCAISLGDDPNALVCELQDRFPRANFIGGDAEFEQMVAQVVGFVESPCTGLDLPLDIRGTVFQTRVWQALRKIPLGSTVTYSEIAQQIGSPKAVRAVASACASNTIAIAIPCHRVVRRDGSLSGYRWGVDRKRTLIEREAQTQDNSA
jgi:AraC family transcriptional regulator of adaptative response/methylated-DNA-[protein]-cysteine methyltransferase